MLDRFNLIFSHLDSLHQPFEGGVESLQDRFCFSEPHPLSISLRQFFHPPEQLLTEEGSSLALEDNREGFYDEHTRGF